MKRKTRSELEKNEDENKTKEVKVDELQDEYVEPDEFSAFGSENLSQNRDFFSDLSQQSQQSQESDNEDDGIVYPLTQI